MADVENTIENLEETRDQIIDEINTLDTSSYFGRNAAEELDYDLGQIEMEIAEHYDKN